MPGTSDRKRGSLRVSEGSPRARYAGVRSATEALSRPLTAEDCGVQSMPDASPTKWHLAHTSWFFETFVLRPEIPGYRPFHPQFGYLFNSYYESVGDRHARPQRGVLSRPTLDEVYSYRAHVDAAMTAYLDGAAAVPALVELGLQHEQQHQELILTDIKHAFWCNALRPAYREPGAMATPPAPPLSWMAFPAGIRAVGADGSGFAYDNELPRHRVFVEPFELASRLVTNAEYLAFIADSGYRRPELWLSEGWETVRAMDWRAPLYWEQRGDEWQVMTLHGMRAIDGAEPVCHVSYYEADAYARWAGARLPSEFEWEVAAAAEPITGNFVESGRLHPAAASNGRGLSQLFGDAWEWTASAYAPYPGYRTPAGAVGEYNGKFMCNQLVLRGGSCVTPQSHIRASYRNFFPASARWQFSGIRLARSVLSPGS